jgi:hypothetical protein
LEVAFTILFVVIFFAVIGLVIYLGIIADRKRTEQLRTLAGELGMNFLSEDNALHQRLQRMHLFTLGAGHAVKNVIHGNTQAVDLSIFDYQFTTGSGKNRTTTHQTVAFFEAGDLDLPGFQLTPENVLHRFAGLFGYQDLNFESHPRFSKQYLLRGMDEERIRQLFRDDALEFFEQHPELSVEGDGHQLIVFRKGQQCKPDDIRAFLELSFAVYNQLRSLSA